MKAALLQVKFVMDDETSLADLLALNLHDFEEEVRNIVDKATKELSMEKVLAELNNTWSVMELEYEEHYRTRISLLKTSEELIETLEDNQVCCFLCHLLIPDNKNILIRDKMFLLEARLCICSLSLRSLSLLSDNSKHLFFIPSIRQS